MEHFNALAPVVVGKIVLMMVGVFGGVARFLSDVLDGKKQFAWGGLTMKVVSSAFFGYMGGEVAGIVFSNPDATYLIAGILGFLGPEGMDFVISKFLKKA
jgi:hypothetical protein